MPNISFNNENEIVPPKKSRGFMMTFDEWDFLKRKIQSLKAKSEPYTNAGYGLLGIGGGGVFSCLQLPDSKFTLGATVGSLVGGFFCLLFGRSMRQVKEGSVEEIGEYMTLIDQRYGNSATTVAPAPNTAREICILVRTLTSEADVSAKVSQWQTGAHPAYSVSRDGNSWRMNYRSVDKTQEEAVLADMRRYFGADAAVDPTAV